MTQVTCRLTAKNAERDDKPRRQKMRHKRAHAVTAYRYFPQLETFSTPTLIHLSILLSDHDDRRCGIHDVFQKVLFQNRKKLNGQRTNRDKPSACVWTTEWDRVEWLPTEWHLPCVRTPVERDGVASFKQFCTIFPPCIWRLCDPHIFNKMPHKTGMPIKCTALSQGHVTFDRQTYRRIAALINAPPLPNGQEI